MQLKKKLKNKIRESILGLRVLDGINFILKQHEQLKEKDIDRLVIMKSEYLEKKREALATGSNDSFLAYQSNFNHRILNYIDIIELGKETNQVSSINKGTLTANQILFEKNQLILKITTKEKVSLVHFKCSYFSNSLFVEEDNFRKPRSFFNILKYHKEFPFSIDDTAESFKLVVNFSLITGLIKNYYLFREGLVLIDSKLH